MLVGLITPAPPLWRWSGSMGFAVRDARELENRLVRILNVPCEETQKEMRLLLQRFGNLCLLERSKNQELDSAQ